jgi:hypothetical protein
MFEEQYSIADPIAVQLLLLKNWYRYYFVPSESEKIYLYRDIKMPILDTSTGTDTNSNLSIIFLIKEF